MGRKVPDSEEPLTPEEVLKALTSPRSQKADSHSESEPAFLLRLTRERKAADVQSMNDSGDYSPIYDLPENQRREAWSSQFGLSLMGLDVPDSKIVELCLQRHKTDRPARIATVRTKWLEHVEREGVKGTVREAELLMQYYRAEFPLED
jgi:hypothetical protein